ncbi:MAG TPA: Cof-type HAD-IIB family hydrolase [Methylomirabilota bacterium]|nr:Cof-type HAD-IIB family hydrolase [Methylomirabilota bacterium]
MAVRLIALDIDGTLLDSQWRVPEANRRAIADAAGRGIEVVLVTGRRFPFAQPIARDLGVPVTMIASNGALIRSSNGVTHLRHLFSRATARKVLEAARAWREGTAVIFDRPQREQIILEVAEWTDPHRAGYFSRYRESFGQAVPLESCLVEDPIQVFLSGAVEAIRSAERHLRGVPFSAEFALAATVYEHRDFAMLDILNPICSKGAALAEWVSVRGISRHEVLAIGDNYNDLEMLRFAGIPVVMGNGVAELKGFGWHETLSNDEGGVAVAISRFALAEAGCA